jgi:hypothetical protein
MASNDRIINQQWTGKDVEVAVAEFDVSSWRLPEGTEGNNVIPQGSQCVVQDLNLWPEYETGLTIQQRHSLLLGANFSKCQV